MTNPEQTSENQDPKFNLSYNPENVVHLPPEVTSGPVIGFVEAESEELLVMLEGHFVYHKQDGVADLHRNRVALLYTQGEWEAFIDGVRDHEFDDLLAAEAFMMRDSKDPEGPILMFPTDAIEAFFVAIREGQIRYTFDCADSAIAQSRIRPGRVSNRRLSYLSSNSVTTG